MEFLNGFLAQAIFQLLSVFYMKGFHLRFSTDSNIAKEFHVRTSKLSNDKFKAIKYTRDWYHRWKYFNLNTTVAKNFPVDDCTMCARAKRDMTDIIPKNR